MRMYPIEVSLQDGLIYVTQAGEPDDQQIILTHEQMELVIAWLRSASERTRKSEIAE